MTETFPIPSNPSSHGPGRYAKHRMGSFVYASSTIFFTRQEINCAVSQRVFERDCTVCQCNTAENCYSSSEIRDAIRSSVKIFPSINELKPEQILVIENIVRGKGVFAALLTGFGKSITFQILPAVKKSLERSPVSPLVIVVCPLNSIIKDQVNYLRSLGLKVAFAGESAEIDKRIIEGTAEIDILYGSPESFVGDDKFRGMLSNDLFRKNAFAVVCDEVHTVVHW